MAIPGGGIARRNKQFRMNGLSELQRSLDALPNKLKDKAVKNASAAGARVIQREAKRLVPVGQANSGEHLRDQIVVSRSFKQKGKKKKLKGAVVLGIKDEGRFYAHLVEYGSSRQSAQPFMRPAMENKAAEALKVMAEKLSKEIAKAAGKLTGWKNAKQRRRLTR